MLEQFPQCNAHYDAERNVLSVIAPVHLGVATQTPDGLKVPVVRHAEARSLRDLAAEIRRVSEAARTGKASARGADGLDDHDHEPRQARRHRLDADHQRARDVAIIGVNKAIERPVVLHGAIAVRRIMNLSSSFDHRFVDGYDAAAMIQALKELLEHPGDDLHPRLICQMNADARTRTSRTTP